MGLTEEQFAQVRTAMRLPASAGEVPNDKRSSGRWTVDGIVAFAPCRDENAAGTVTAEPPAKWVNLIDVSPDGASLLSRTQLAPGEHFVLALPGEDEHHLATVCVVQHSRVKLDGTFRIGARFCEPHDAGAERVQAAITAMREMGLYVNDPFRPLVAGAAPAANPRRGASQRRSERRQAEGRAVIHTYDEIGEPGLIEEVPALDFSETGVCIFRREPMKVGEQFMARIPVLNDRPIISLCRVSNCAPAEGGARFRIGAEFVQPAGVLERIARRFMRLFKRAA